MDPITAFGLACNVLQVVEVGIKITKQVKDIHDRGSLSANDEVKQWAKDIAKEEKQLQIDVQAKGHTLGPKDTRVRDLATEAVKVSSELKTILNKIAFAKSQVGKKETAAKQIVRTYLKKSQIDQLTKRLQACETALDRTILRDL